jgi:SNF2 family DNA or RNA helicase
MIEFELKKYNNKYTVRVLKDGSIYLFNEKVSGKYKNILNTLKKFPHFYGEFSIEEVPILDFIDEVKYENKKYKINHSLHTLEFDFKDFYINAKKAIFLSNDYVLTEDGIFKIYYVEDIENLSLYKSKKIDNDYLSILFTNFERLNIKGYDVNYYTEISLKPAIYFEEVLDKNLVFRVSSFIEGINIDTENLTKIAFLNDKSIDVFDVFAQDNIKRLKRILHSNSIEYIQEEQFFILDSKNAEKFLSFLPSISREFEIFGSKHLKGFNIKILKPSLNVRINRGVDLLELDGEVEIDNVKMPLSEFLKQYKKENYLSINNQKYLIDSDYIEKLKRILREEEGKIKVSFFDLPEIERLVNNKDLAVFKKSKEFFEGFKRLKNKKINISLNAKLRDYQVYGIKWLMYLKENNFGGCLADDMGLGKTIQAIALLQNAKNAIVVVPRSLLTSWEEEIKKFAPTMKYHIYYGQNREFKDNCVLITTYGILRSDIDKLKDKEFEIAILDEAQNIKNINSQIHKAVMLLNANYRFALSGTPIENSLSEIYALFRFINPGMFRSFSDFKTKYLIPIEEKKDIEVMNELKAKVSPFILRRLKSEVLSELPPKQEMTILVDMNEEHKRVYEQKKEYYKNLILENVKLKGFNKSKMIIFQALTKLRQIASIPEIEEEGVKSSKLEVMFEQLQDIISNKHKVLIFTNFLYSIDLIANEAQKRGFSYITMSGSTQNRKEVVDKFLNEDIDLFIMTLKTGGVGLNLTKADYVFIFEPWWNVAAENQAIDRVYRIGQKNKVFSYKLITKGTIEEKILELQKIKKDLSNIIDSQAEINLTEKDLEFILGE